MIRINEAETKKLICTITYAQWRHLINQEEFAIEGSYWLNNLELDWLEQDGVDALLVSPLRDALGKQDGLEICWVREMLRIVPTAWQSRGRSLQGVRVPVVFEVLNGGQRLAEIDNRAANSVLTIQGISYEAYQEVGQEVLFRTNGFVLTLDQREIARAEKQSAVSPLIIEHAELRYTLEGEWGSDRLLMEGSTPIGTLSRDGLGVRMDLPDTLPPLITTFVAWLYLG